MKICILGNSHAAALKHGWVSVGSEYPNIDIDIFSMVGQKMDQLELVGHTLSLGSTSKGQLRSFPPTAGDVVNLKSYDGIILHGLGLKYNSALSAAYSKACRKCAVVDATKMTALWKILCEIRKVSDVKIFVGHSPLEAALTVRSRGPSIDYNQYVDTLNEQCFGNLAATILRQPKNTIVNGCKTDPVYNIGVAGLMKEEVENKNARHTDRNHMNPDFGVEMMRSFLIEFS